MRIEDEIRKIVKDCIQANGIEQTGKILVRNTCAALNLLKLHYVFPPKVDEQLQEIITSLWTYTELTEVKEEIQEDNQ